MLSRLISLLSRIPAVKWAFNRLRPLPHSGSIDVTPIAADEEHAVVAVIADAAPALEDNASPCTTTQTLRLRPRSVIQTLCHRREPVRGADRYQRQRRFIRGGADRDCGAAVEEIATSSVDVESARSRRLSSSSASIYLRESADVAPVVEGWYSSRLPKRRRLRSSPPSSSLKTNPHPSLPWRSNRSPSTRRPPRGRH